MFVRMSFLSGDPSRIDDLVTYARTVVKPATDELDGNHGLGMWVNRTSGDAMVMTVWRDEAALQASETAVVKLRDDAAGIIGGLAVVERYETALLDGSTAHRVGNTTRMLRMHGQPDELDRNVEWARDTVVARMRTLDGYLTYALGIDRASGAVVGMSTFADAASAAAAWDAMSAIRDLLPERGMHLDSMMEYEVAIVGIRGGITLPGQRPVDVTEQADTRTRT